MNLIQETENKDNYFTSGQSPIKLIKKNLSNENHLINELIISQELVEVDRRQKILSG
jgi:hypothetical protein